MSQDNQTADPADNDPNAESTGNELSPAQPIASTEGVSEGAVDGEDTGDFDPAAVAAMYGVPAGTLSGVEDMDGAISAIRSYTDQKLIAGLGADDDEETPPPPAKVAADDKKGGNAEIDALRAELAEVKASVSKQFDRELKQKESELDRRIKAEIDSWQSPRYGVGKTRNFNQTKATKNLSKLLRTHIRGHEAGGEPLPLIEVLLRQVRVFDDDTFKPTTTKAADKGAVGTPGTSRETKEDKDAPRSIHHAFQQNPF